METCVGCRTWQRFAWGMRPSEVDVLISDPTKARQKLNWEPKVKFRELVEMMVEADLKRLKDTL